MAYIPPNSTIYLCSGVPLDNSYKHTIYWESEQDKFNYFTAMPSPCVWRGQNYSYVRDSENNIIDNKIRINSQISNVIDSCNYLVYINLSHESHFRYAFITSIRYINENCIEIEFEIDIIQSFFEYDKLQQCIVERNTIPKSEDTYHSHIFPEPIDLSEFTEDEGHYVTMATDLWANGMDIIIWSTLDTSGKPLANYEGGIWSGIYSGLKPVNFHLDASNPATTIKQINDFLSAANSIGLSDAIITATVFPTSLLPANINTVANKVITKRYLIPGRDGTYATNGWGIKNNKCYNYPYLLLTVCDGCGRYKNYNLNAFDYADGRDNIIYFDLMATLSPNPQIAIFPEYYKGCVNYNANSIHNTSWLNTFQAFRNGSPVNIEEGFYMSDMPSITLPLPSFLSQLAYNVGQVLIPNALKFAGLAMATGSMLGGALASNATQTFSNVVDMEGNPTPVSRRGPERTVNDDRIMGGFYALSSTALNIFDQDRNQARNFSSNSAMVGACLNDFYFRFTSLRLRYLWAMDEYFTKYGYNVNKLEKPRINNRSRYTYIKTKDCCYIGNAPVSVITAIQDIFNSGITFWKSPAYIANYSFDNE